MGSFLEAAVEGLMSWVGEGWRLIERDWRVDAISPGADMLSGLLMRVGLRILKLGAI